MLAAEESSQSWPTNTEKCQDIDTKWQQGSADSSETDESDNKCDAIDPGVEYDSSDVVLAFINSNEEDANDRPNATRS